METYNGETVVKVQNFGTLTMVSTLANGASPDGEDTLNVYVIEN